MHARLHFADVHGRFQAGFWGQFGGSPAVGYNPLAGWLVSVTPSACHYRFQTSGTQPRLSPGKAQAGKS